MDYTLGFMFSKDKEKVLLILKDRPKWQEGKLNGIGGKFDHFLDSESDPRTCQVREFKEETGIITEVQDWEPFLIINGIETENKTGTVPGSPYRIYCYRCFSNKINEAKQVESEKPIILSVRHLANTTIAPLLPNVNWLIPMALYHNNSVIELKYN